MSSSWQQRIPILLFSLFFAGCGGSGSGGSGGSSSASYYLDCTAPTNGSGAQDAPWNSLTTANTHEFGPGDQLLVRRGTSCSGAFSPIGSGRRNAPMIVDAYDSGTPPVLNGGGASAAVYLSGQSYWTIRNLEITGGVTYGIYIASADGHSIRGITLKNLDVHSASGQSAVRADSGLVMLTVTGVGESISDVLIDGVTAHDSQVAEGIFVGAGDWSSPSGVKGDNIVIQNSVAHHVGGDGILLMGAENSLMQGNTVHHSGLCTACTGSTPVGLWVWNSRNVVIQYNESYANSSWGVDGGGFDIDFWNSQIMLQYNYAHDNSGYCLAVFGAENAATTDSIVRYNICSNNMQASSYTGIRSEIVVYTWNGGVIDGLAIHNNTIYSNPVLTGPVVSLSQSTYAGGSRTIFKNNLIYAENAQSLIDVIASAQVDYNLYFVNSGAASWSQGATTYLSWGDYRTATGQDAHSSVADPNLNNPSYHGVGIDPVAFVLQSISPAIDAGVDVCALLPSCNMGARDIAGNSIPQGSMFDVGANEYVP